MIKIWAIKFLGSIGEVRYETEAYAWRAVHELLEEAFGENYGVTEIADYDVVKVA